MFNKTQLGVEAPGIYKLQYDKILGHQYRKSLSPKGEAKYEFTLTEKGLNSLNKKLVQDGYYVSKALKDRELF